MVYCFFVFLFKRMTGFSIAGLTTTILDPAVLSEFLEQFTENIDAWPTA